MPDVELQHTEEVVTGVRIPIGMHKFAQAKM